MTLFIDGTKNGVLSNAECYTLGDSLGFHQCPGSSITPISVCCEYCILVNATALGSLIQQLAVTRCNLAVSDMYMRVFGKTHQIAYMYCSVGISDLKPLTGTSEDQLLHRKSRPLATA